MAAEGPATTPAPTMRPGSRRGERFDYDRTVALSDGVFAIALTLLVLTIPQPASGDDLWGQLDDLLPDLGAYALSFVVIAAQWRYHHVFLRGVDHIDGRLTTLNLLYLGLIALIPFPTELISEYGNESAGVIAYAATLAAVGAMVALMGIHAERAGLTAPTGRGLLERFAVPLVFLVSMPIAALSPGLALWSWLSLIPLGHLLGRRADERERAAAT